MFANFTCDGGGSNLIDDDNKRKICDIAETELDDCGYSPEETHGGVLKFSFTYHQGDEDETMDSLTTTCHKAHKEKSS